MLSSPPPTDLSTFLSFPSPEKLLRLGPKVSVLIVQQVRAFPPSTPLKIRLVSELCHEGPCCVLAKLKLKNLSFCGSHLCMSTVGVPWAEPLSFRLPSCFQSKPPFWVICAAQVLTSLT